MTEFIKGSGWRAVASWYDSAGNRHRKRKSWFRTKKEAQKWERQYLQEHADLKPEAADLTVRQWLSQFLQLQSGILAENTISGYTANCNAINRYIGDIPLDKLRKIDIELMFQKMSEETVKGGKPIRAATLRYRMRTLRAALNCAIENGYIRRNACERVRMPVMDDTFTPKVIPAEDGGTILTALREHDGQLYLMVLLSIVYGLRRGEAMGIRWQDVDEREIRVCGQYTQGKEGCYYKQALKTSSSYRTLAMVPFVWQELAAVAEANRKMGRIAVYVCELDGKMPTPNAMSSRWKKFAKEHGAAGVRYHDLRHSAAMMMIENGSDLNAVKHQLGHSKISTTEMYLHADYNQSEQAASAIVSNLFPVSREEKAESQA